MPWTCPACKAQVVHSTTALPRTDRLYRCPICRLEMTFDPHLQKMMPLDPNGGNGNTSSKVA